MSTALRLISLCEQVSVKRRRVVEGQVDSTEGWVINVAKSASMVWPKTYSAEKSWDNYYTFSLEKNGEFTVKRFGEDPESPLAAESFESPVEVIGDMSKPAVVRHVAAIASKRLRGSSTSESSEDLPQGYFSGSRTAWEESIKWITSETGGEDVTFKWNNLSWEESSDSGSRDTLEGVQYFTLRFPETFDGWDDNTVVDRIVSRTTAIFYKQGIILSKTKQETEEGDEWAVVVEFEARPV